MFSAWQDGKAIVDIGVLNTEQEQIRANVKYNCAQGWQQCEPHEQNDFELMILGGGPSIARVRGRDKTEPRRRGETAHFKWGL